ncbi:hypothetical protein [Notoacmeibacter ruber]|uniref:Pentapeptide repeat-containing protein n=1 Tax=Notoacmeibacter ruber TaxID=2670375 RepID=A0A3L7JDD0_9HYPH|nr:hypothetical protein [Notoacmeibacter ruber]RLQ88315.1 hypothetical protein D8780_08960 [Notoacmeibacter ruber]
MMAGNEFNHFSGADGAPTEAERRLCNAVFSGESADCSDLSEDDRIVSAALLEALALETFHHSDWSDGQVGPEGIGANGLIFRDQPDLEWAEIRFGLRFAGSHFKAGLRLPDAHIRGALRFDECEIDGTLDVSDATIDGQFAANNATFRNAGGTAVKAQSCTAKGWFMLEAEVDGLFDINSATIDGQFVANSAKFRNASETAVNAQGCTAKSWFMDGAEVDGLFDINSATLDGPFVANNVKFRNAGKKAIYAQGCAAKGWCTDGAEVDGLFDINSATLGGQFAANNAKFRNAGEMAVNAQGCAAIGWFMNGAEVHGLFDINSATLDSQFSANNAKFCNTGAVAISAQDCGAKGWFVDGAEVDGLFDMNSATINVQFNANNAKFRNAGGMAVQAATSRAGQWNLADAVIDGWFCGHSMSADHFNAFLCVFTCSALASDDTTSDVTERLVALDLRSARIDGQLVLPGRTPRGIVDLSRARCDTLVDTQSGWAPPLRAGGQICAERECLATESGAIDCQHFILDGFTCRHFEYPDGVHETPVAVGSGRFQRLRNRFRRAPAGEDAIAAARIDWLAGQPAANLTLNFDPQPWRMTASVLREMGYDRAANKVTIERRLRARRAHGTPLGHRFVGWFLHLVSDYGYRPGKTLLWSLAVIAFAGSLFWGGEQLCANGACGGTSAADGAGLFQPVRVGDTLRSEAGGTAADYPPFRPFLHAFDTFVPILDFNVESFWRADTDRFLPVTLPESIPGIGADERDRSFNLAIGWLALIRSMALRLLGAILTAITIVGFTGVLQHEER